MHKKVIIVIVEGVSDEALLIDRLRQLYGGNEIRFEIQNGDIFNNMTNRQSIKNVIGSCISSLIDKRKYLIKDILAVLHLTDTDGCMIPDDSVVVVPEQTIKTAYFHNMIGVCDVLQKQRIITRNCSRRVGLSTMSSTSAILGNKLRYQLFYFSRNLEHVIFNEPNPSDEDKVEKVDSFIESLDITIELYLKNFFPPLELVDYEQCYRESWNYIAQRQNSLMRCTNTSLLFDYIRTLS